MIGHSGVDHAVATGLAVAAIAGYGAAWLRLAHARPARLLGWAAGVVVVLASTTPWVERAAERSFTGHMVQHLAVIVLAAPLLVLARPFQAVTGSRLVPPTAAGRRLGAWWRRRGPFVGPPAFVVVLIATHLSGIYDEALHNRWLHEAEHAAYLLAAVATWSSVLGGRRTPALARAGIAMGVAAGGALLGMVLLTAPEPLIPTYAARLGTAEALVDQRNAAALMWIGGMATTVPLLLVGVWRWAAAEHRAAQRAEALADGRPVA